MSNPNSLFYRSLAFAVSALVLASCANTQPRSIESEVKNRVAARWQALLARDVSKAYDYISPGQRAVESRDSYTSGFGNKLTYVSAVPVTVKCDSNERCNVVVSVESKVPVPGFANKTIKSDVIEVWIYENREWWFFRQ